MKQNEFLAPAVKTCLVGAATLFMAHALLDGNGVAQADRSVQAEVEPQAGETAHRVSVSSATIRAKLPAQININPVGTDGPEVVGPDALDRLTRGGKSQTPGNEGGVAGGNPNCPNPNPDADCFEDHGFGPGCNDEDCCNAVCDLDSFCCDSDWDQVCADHAADLCAACPDLEPACTEHITPGAIYSNWHPDCSTGFAFTHGGDLYADDLWYGENGGTLEELTFSVFNDAANGTLLNVSLEVILSSTMPGSGYGAGGGFLDLTNAIVIIEVELDETDLDGGLDPGSSALFTLPNLAPFEIFLPVPMVYAGIRYIDAQFQDNLGDLSSLGQALIGPPGLGASSDSLFMEGFSATGFFGGDPPARAGWELVTDGDFGSARVLFDNAPQQAAIFDVGGVPTESNFGWQVGQASSATPHIRHAQAFTLPAGADNWRINGIYPHGFLPGNVGPNLQTLHWAIWERNGVENPPVAGEEVAQGSIPYPAGLHLSHGQHNIGGRVHPIPVEGVVLPPGEYYLTVHGTGAPGVFPSHFAWFMNAGNAVKMLNANGPYMWYTGNYDTTPFSMATTTGQPNSCQPDPETTWYTVFFILGEADDDPTPPCPGDLTGSGSVGVPDLLALLACWGPVAPGCENADLTGSGSVGVPDLLELLAAWGPCPE